MGEIELSLGVLGGTLSSQLKAQGFELDENKIGKYENIRKSISVLNIHGYLSDSATQKSRQKLIKDIAKDVIEISK